MHDSKQRLARCFSTVFPEFSPEEIGKTSACCSLDSLSTVTLMAVVQEEFGIDLKVEDMENFPSFEGVLERVNEAIRSRIASEPSAFEETPGG
jgi:acyl carrier protein